MPRRDRDKASAGEFSAKDVCRKPEFAEGMEVGPIGSRTEGIAPQHSSVQRVSALGAADLLKMAVVRGRLNAALQDLEVKVTKFREHANGMPQGES